MQEPASKMGATTVTPRVLTAQHVLETAFPAGPGLQKADWCVHSIPQHGEPRWIVLGEVRKALPVLRSWRPWNLSSRMRWSAVLAAAASGMLARLPGVRQSRVTVDMTYWRHECLLKSVGLDAAQADSIVIHVGNRSHTRKAILFFVDEGGIGFAAKIPLVDGAAEAILNEAAALRALEGNTFLPRTLCVDVEHGIAAQSWLEGKPVARGLTPAHMELLGRLARPGSVVRMSDFLQQSAAGLDKLRGPFDAAVLHQALEFLHYDEPLPAFVEHRDFAPWNLKWLAGSKLGLLDWEWAALNSLPWQDICRFFYVEDAHFHGPGNVWEQMTSNRLLRAHCEQFSIPQRALPSLTMHYLLRVLSMDWLSGNDFLARHSYGQIRRLLAVGRDSRLA